VWAASSTCSCSAAANAPETRAGARLVQVELSGAASRLADVERAAKWWVFYEMAIKAWDDYRGVLSAELTRDEWMTVSQSVLEIQGLHVGMTARVQAGPPATPAMAVGGVTVKAVPAMRHNATQAYNALCRLAETDREPGLLPGSPPPGIKVVSSGDPDTPA
jgi:hypothetical protein